MVHRSRRNKRRKRCATPLPSIRDISDDEYSSEDDEEISSSREKVIESLSDRFFRIAFFLLATNICLFGGGRHSSTTPLKSPRLYHMNKTLHSLQRNGTVSSSIINKREIKRKAKIAKSKKKGTSKEEREKECTTWMTNVSKSCISE